MTTARLAAEAIAALGRAGARLATAESLTGGLLAAALVDIPGASEVFAGGVVAYTAEAKTGVLGVDADLVDRRGTVDPDVAQQMAVRARILFGADYGIATTGVAGPGPHEGRPAGTVFVGLAGPGCREAFALHLDGDRDAIRRSSVERALGRLRAAIG